jgi:hypothetical protein
MAAANVEHIAEHESFASKDLLYNAALPNMNASILENMKPSPKSMSQNLIKSPTKHKEDSRAATDNLNGGSSERLDLYNIKGHGENFRQVDGYGERAAGTRPNG